MNNFSKLFLFGIAGGLVGSYFFIFISGKYLANISQPAIPTPLITAVPEHGSWENIISKASLNSVAIQVLKDNRLVRQGSGLIISSDGLIVTSADLAVAGAVYQVFYEDRIVKGTVADLNYDLNLLLLKTPDSYANVADFSDAGYHNGTDIVLVGKFVSFAKPVIFSQSGTVSYITDNNVVIDTNPSSNLNGAGVISREGNFIGLSFLRNGKVNLAKTSSVESFFEQYIAKGNKK